MSVAAVIGANPNLLRPAEVMRCRHFSSCQQDSDGTRLSQPMKAILTVKTFPHQFAAHDFIAGDAALDFVNTVNGRDRSPCDWIETYSGLVKWAAMTDLLPARVLKALAQKAREAPQAAAAALERARSIREALFALSVDLIAGRVPDKNLLALLGRHWVAGTSAHELAYVEGRMVVRLSPKASDLDLIATEAARRLVERLLTLPGDRLRICQGTNCAWLFFDTSKAGRRRWCDMAVCGNAAKSRRSQARAKRNARAGSPG
jgi:predicted RNA-binding Zn ribbon-like protein